MIQKIIVRYGLILGLGILSLSDMQAQQTYRSSGTKSQSTAARDNSKKGFDASRLIYGGGLFGGCGSNVISIGVSPIAGYRITDFWSAGISLGYKYFFYRDYFSVYNYDWQRYEEYNLNNHIFVPGVWTRLRVFRNIFTHFEFENVISTYKAYDIDYNNNFKHYSFRKTESVPCLLVGGGLRQPINEHSSFVMYALYDVLQNIPGNVRTAPNGTRLSRSPYARTIDIRVGLNIGF